MGMYSSFEYVSLINSGLLVFLRLIFDQGICFRVHKFFMAWYFLGSFLGFPTVNPILFTPEYPRGKKQSATRRTMNANQKINLYRPYALVKRNLHPQGPHSQILMTGGGDRGSYFVPKKITTSEFVYPKKSLLLFAYPKKSLSPFFATPENLSVLLRPKNIPVSFHRPQKITLDQNFRPQKITRTPFPPSLKYVSGASGPPSLPRDIWGNWLALTGVKTEKMPHPMGTLFVNIHEVWYHCIPLCCRTLSKALFVFKQI